MHLEAALITGASFPTSFPPDETTDPSFQAPILQVMSNHRFFQRIGIPEPMPLPKFFRETVFIRDAPSKLGRQPLFYLITGLPVHWMTSGILEALYLCRIINLLVTLLGAFCLYIILGRLYPAAPLIRLMGLFFLITQPLFWQMGSSMTPDAWKFLLMSIGFLCVIARPTSGSRLLYNLICISWFMAVAATSWTLVPLAVVISTGFLPKDSNRSISSNLKRRIVPLAFLVAAVLIAFLISDRTLIYHEMKHIVTAFQGLPAKSSNIKTIVQTLFQTYWTGFGWLSIPTNLSTLLLFSLVSSIGFAGLIRYFCGVRFKGDSDPIRRIVIVFCVLGAGMVIFRALSDEPSIQGRYFFPILPGILIAGTRGLFLIRSPMIRRVFLFIAVLCGFLGDIAANTSGWMLFQHYGYQAISDPVQAMAHLRWVDSYPTRHVLDSRDPQSSAFFYKGWYPPEPGNTHRWMMKESETLLPFVSTQNALMRMEINPFLSSEQSEMSIQVSLNGQILESKEIQPGWRTYTFFVSQNEWVGGLNRLGISAHNVGSPSDSGENSDRRFLSIALRRIDIIPLIYTGGIDEIFSGWFFTPDMQARLHLNAGDRIEVLSDETGDFFFSTSVDGQRYWTELTPGEQFEFDTAFRISRIEFDQARPNQAVEIFRSFQQSIGMLPEGLSDVYFHLYLFAVWLLIYSISVVFLLVAYAYSRRLTL